VYIPWNGWTEQDFRTPDEPIAGLTAINDSPTLLGRPTTLTATVAAGTNVSYRWALGDSASGMGAVLTHTCPAVGVYTAVVTAKNPVNIVTATTDVTIIPLCQPVTHTACTWLPLTPTVGEEVTFNGSAARLAAEIALVTQRSPECYFDYAKLTRIYLPLVFKSASP